tara:strand:- start:309 stop:686 length:378 start_codon:yes stop_codon:yes gene_type:complete
MRNGIITNTLVADLKDLRAYVVEENIPLLAKVIRLTYQHVEENDDFLIAIPEEEPVSLNEDGEVEEAADDEEAIDAETNIIKEEIKGQESLEYLLSLMADHSNKLNEMELREYVAALKEEAGEDY